MLRIFLNSIAAVAATAVGLVGCKYLGMPAYAVVLPVCVAVHATIR